MPSLLLPALTASSPIAMVFLSTQTILSMPLPQIPHLSAFGLTKAVASQAVLMLVCPSRTPSLPISVATFMLTAVDIIAWISGR